MMIKVTVDKNGKVLSLREHTQSQKQINPYIKNREVKAVLIEGEKGNNHEHN